MEWIVPKNKKPENGQVVIIHMGYGFADPINTRVAEYDSKEDCFVFGKADGDFACYTMYGFVRTEMVSGWIPFPDLKGWFPYVSAEMEQSRIQELEATKKRMK